MTSQPVIENISDNIEETFRLNASQMEFMMNIDAAAEQADHDDNYDFFDEVVSSDEWQRLFNDMNWDQAYDRYEIMIGRCEDC